MKYFAFIISFFALIFCIIFLWNKEKYPLNSDYIRAVYQIEIPTRFNSKDCVSIRNIHTVILVLTEQEIHQLLSKNLLGYTNWRQVTPDESYGSSDVLVNGDIDKHLMEAHRVTNSFEQRIIINTITGKVILISA